MEKCQLTPVEDDDDIFTDDVDSDEGNGVSDSEITGIAAASGATILITSILATMAITCCFGAFCLCCLYRRQIK